jgi:nucleoid DNA-binding protein
VTKKEIVKTICDRANAEKLIPKHNLTQLATKEIVQWTFEAIIDTLVTEGRIELRNFGVFEVKQRKPRKARNPRTGDPVEVEAKNVVTFQPGKSMEEEVRKAKLPPPKPKKPRKTKAAAAPANSAGEKRRARSPGRGRDADEPSRSPPTPRPPPDPKCGRRAGRQPPECDHDVGRRAHSGADAPRSPRGASLLVARLALAVAFLQYIFRIRIAAGVISTSSSSSMNSRHASRANRTGGLSGTVLSAPALRMLVRASSR